MDSSPSESAGPSDSPDSGISSGSDSGSSGMSVTSPPITSPPESPPLSAGDGNLPFKRERSPAPITRDSPPPTSSSIKVKLELSSAVKSSFSHQESSKPMDWSTALKNNIPEPTRLVCER